jgi:ABC-2 type transport system permease protein
MSETGVIHDIGYRRYEGTRLGRGHILRSMYAHSMRTAFGLGRGVKAKLFPWAVAGVVAAVAVVLTAINSRSPEPVSTYPEFVDSMSVPAILFLAAAAPELVSRDLRARVLTLYFARPVRRSDYVYAKFAALISALFLVIAGPQLIIFAGAAFASDSVSEFRRHLTDLLGGWLYTGVFVVITASLALLVASLTGKRMFAAAGIVAVFVVTIPMAAVVWELGGSGAVRELSGLVTPTWLVMGIGEWLLGLETHLEVDKLGPVYGAAGVALVAACVAILLARYRRVEQ